MKTNKTITIVLTSMLLCGALPLAGCGGNRKATASPVDASSRPQDVATAPGGSSIEWSLLSQFGAGNYSSLAATDDGTVVMVCQGADRERTDLRCSVGRIDWDERHWYKTVYWGEGHKYTTGASPDVAVSNDGTVVEVHTSSATNTLWYTVGVVDRNSKTIAWASCHNYTKGSNPTVALMGDGTVVEIHNDWRDKYMWYQVGKVNLSSWTIEWGGGHKYVLGRYPSVAVRADGTIVEVHNLHNRITSWHNVGRVDSGAKSISWGAAREHGTGSNPVVTMAGDGTVVQVNEDEKIRDYVSYMVGKVNQSSTGIDWGPVQGLDVGKWPSVTMTNDGVVVEVCNNMDGLLWQKIGKLRPGP